MPAAAIILAAGLGTRMRSALPKAMHPVAGRPMINHLVSACEQVFDRIVVVVGPDMSLMERAVAPHATVVQADRLGTGHAARMAAPLLRDFDGDVAVLYADNPLITVPTIRKLMARRASPTAIVGLAGSAAVSFSSRTTASARFPFRAYKSAAISSYIELFFGSSFANARALAMPASVPGATLA